MSLKIPEKGAWEWESSGVKGMLSKHEALGSIPSTKKRTK